MAGKRVFSVFQEAENKCRELIELSLKGLNYYQTYDWAFLMTTITLGYAGWIAIIVTFLLKHYTTAISYTQRVYNVYRCLFICTDFGCVCYWGYCVCSDCCMVVVTVFTSIVLCLCCFCCCFLGCCITGTLCSYTYVYIKGL